MEARDPSEAAAWRSYRCPVCSHTEGVLLTGTDAALIRCSYCDTPLEVTARGGGLTADAKVVRSGLRAKERV